MLKRFSVLSLVFMCLVISSCATTGQPMSQKQQGVIWMSTYISVYDDTMSVMSNPLSSPEQKSFALKKKDILTKVWPLLKVYMSTVDNGGTPTMQDVIEISNYINQLVTMTGGH